MIYDKPKTLDIADQDFLNPSRLIQQGLHTSNYVHYTGLSMYPTFHDPEFLLIDRPPFENFRLGDIVIFKSPLIETLVIHRIIRKLGSTFVTKGDNNNYIDAYPVPYEAIHGRAVGILTRKGIRPVRNGFAGLIEARLHRVRAFVKHHLLRPLVWNTLTIHSRKALTRYLFIKPRFVVFRNVDQSLMIRFIWNNRTIGFYDGRRKKTVIQRLYRIGINRSYLDSRVKEIISSEPSSESSDRNSLR